MVIPNKSLLNGFKMPIFGIGTWQMGGRKEYDPQNDDAADIEAIQTAIEWGVTHIDTAELYANGHTEEFIRQALQKYDRSKLFLVSKTKHFQYDQLLDACTNSLIRLGTTYLDLYLIHYRDFSTNLEETMQAMNYLKKQGLIKNIGVSNFSVKSLQEAQQYSEAKIVVNQVHYNLMYREPERAGLLAYCQAHDIMLVAWRPVEKGVLTQNPPEILRSLCQKYDKSPAQIAINWLISQDNVVTISKSRNKDHLKDNLGSIGWNLTSEDIEFLRHNYPQQADKSNTLPLDALPKL